MSPDVSLRAPARALKPFVELPYALGDDVEIVVRASPDGLAFEQVDVANVMALHAHIHADAFDRFDIPDAGLQFGLPVGSIHSSISAARIGESYTDHIGIEAETGESIDVTVERDDLHLTESFGWLAKDSVRVSDPPDLADHPFDATTDALQIGDIWPAIERLDARFSHVTFEMDDGGLVIESNSPQKATHPRSFRATVDWVDVDVDSPASGSYSVNYIASLFGGLKRAKVDAVTIKLSDDFPITVEFDRASLYDGHFAVAPRIER